MMLRVSLALMLVLAFMNVAHAAQIDESGNAFLMQCSAIERASSSLNNLTTQEIVDVNLCFMYLRGLNDGVHIEQFWLEHVSRDKAKLPVPACVPDEVSSGQALRVVVKYIRDHPDIAHLSTAQLVVNAMGTAFPCTEGK